MGGSTAIPPTVSTQRSATPAESALLIVLKEVPFHTYLELISCKLFVMLVKRHSKQQFERIVRLRRSLDVYKVSEDEGPTYPKLLTRVVVDSYDQREFEMISFMLKDIKHWKFYAILDRLVLLGAWECYRHLLRIRHTIGVNIPNVNLLMDATFRPENVRRIEIMLEEGFNGINNALRIAYAHDELQVAELLVRKGAIAYDNEFYANRSVSWCSRALPIVPLHVQLRALALEHWPAISKRRLKTLIKKSCTASVERVRPATKLNARWAWMLEHGPQ